MADTIEVKYKADLSGIQKDTKAYEETLKGVETQGKKTFKGVEDAAKTATTGIESSLKGVAAGVAAAFSVQKIIAFAEESIKAFAKSEAQTQKLKFAIESITKDGGSFDRLVKQSEQLQQSLKIFDAEDIQAIQAMQLQYGLTANQVEKLTPLILELSAAQGVDLVTATDTALKAIEGQTRGLKTIGAAFDDTGNSTDNFNILTEKLSKLQGSAADALNTTNGQLRAQEVAMENIQESIGQRISPAFLNLKQGALEAADAVTTLFFALDPKGEAIKRIEGLKGIFKTDSTNDIRKKIQDIKKELEDPNLAPTRIDALNARLAAANSVLLDRYEAEKQAGKDSVRNAEIQRLAKENLLALSKKELEEEIKTLEAKGDNTKEFQDQIERRKTALVELIKAQKDAGEKLAKQRADDAEKAKAQAEKAAADELKALEKLEQDLAKRTEDNTPNILKAIDNDTQTKINGFKEQYIQLGDFSATAQKELDDKITQAKLDGLRIQIAETKAAGLSTVDLEAEVNDIIIKGNEDKNAEILKQEQDTIEKRKQLLSDLFNAVGNVTNELFNLFQADNEARQQELEARTEAELSVYDDKQAALDKQKERGAITDREYQRRSIELTEQRTAAEKKAANEQKKLQAESARLSRELAIFEIILNTAKGIIAALGSTPPNPFLAAAIGVTGALELATAVSQPLPKFFKGTKSVQGKEGIDQVPAMLTKGERVVPVERNRKNWEYYEAIDNNNLEALIFRKHIVPALQDYQRKQEATTAKRNNEEIGKIIYANFAGLTAYEADRLRKKGVNINNLNELREILQESQGLKHYGSWSR